MGFLEKIGFKTGDEPTSSVEKNAGEQEALEKSVEKESASLALPTIEDFKVILEDQEEISVDDIENLTGILPEEFIKSITGDENIKIKDIKDFHEAIKKAHAEPKEKYQERRFRKLANNNFFKAGVLSLILFLKFAPHSEAAPGKLVDNRVNNTEAAKKAENKIDGGDDKTYHLDGNGPNPNEAPAMEKLAKLDLTNSYETDKADIPNENRAAIEAQVHNFLNEINSDNYRDLMTHVWEISGSSDERLTSSWEGGNEELTNARIAEAAKIIKGAIESYDFSHSGLSAKQVEDLKNKSFIYDSYESQNGPEKGVTYLTDLKNPDTGVNYTAEEIQEIKEHNEKKYYSLLDKCRYIKVNLMAEGDEIKPIPNRPAELKTSTEFNLLDRKIPEFQQYKSVLILEDNSGSMTASKEAMARYLVDNYSPDIKVTTAIFSDRLDNFRPLQDMRDAAESLRETRNSGNSSERTIKCAVDALKLFTAQEKPGDGLALIGTDEALQGVSYNDLKALDSLSKVKNVDIKFLIVHLEDGEKVTEKVPLEKIIENFNDPNGAYKRTKANLERYANNPRVHSSTRKAFQERLSNINDNSFTMKKLTIEDSEGDEKEIELALY